MKDINYVELNIGDKVALAVNRYDTTRLVIGEVTKIGTRKTRFGSQEPCVYVGTYYTTDSDRIIKL